MKKVIQDGCGMRLTARLGRYWPICLAGAMTDRSPTQKLLEPFSDLKSSVLMDGVPCKTPAQCMKWVNGDSASAKHLRLRTRIKRHNGTICFFKIWGYAI